MSDCPPALSILVSRDGLRLYLSYASSCSGWPPSPEAGFRTARMVLEEALKGLEAPDRVQLVAHSASPRRSTPEEGGHDRELRRLRALLDAAEERACRAERDLRRQRATVEALLACLAKADEATEPDRPPPLTPREGEVLALMGEGLSNREIGERLFIAERTVRKHAESIFRKLGVEGRNKAVARARRLGLL